MKTIKIFLASSAELKEDREQLELLIGRINKSKIKKGVFFELIIWEDFLDAMSQTRLQDEYNKALKECDVFISLFFTKVGIYTAEEFETAFGNFKDTGEPFIYTYFKESQVNIGNLSRDVIGLFDFKDKLKKLGHFPTSYSSIEDLKYKITDQLNKLLENKLIGEKPLSIEPQLLQLLEKEKRNCKENNIYVYGPSLILAILQIKNGLVFSALDQVKKGYPQFLKAKLEDFIETGLIQSGKAKGFVEQDWFSREEIINAGNIAKAESSENINEKHLLLGIYETGGNTIKMIKSDLTENSWSDFLSRIKSNRTDYTPTII